jgi:predicted acetyltransferase
MTKAPSKPSPEPELVPATAEQQSILANLIELYAHDFSEFHPVALGPDGRFGYPHLPLYWRERGRHPFLVKVHGQLAGFVLVKRGSDFTASATVWDMAEFFVARGYRRRGIGSEIAHQVWRRFPGPWQVRVMESNTAALHFWQRAITSFAGKPVSAIQIEKRGELWHVFTFESAAT